VSAKQGLLPLVAAGVTMTLWASAFIAIRVVGADYSPGALALGRLSVGAIVLSAVAAVRPVRVPRGRPLLLVLAYGVLWFGVYAVLVNAAEHHLDAGTTALVVNVGPIFIVVLAGIYLKEGFPRGLVTGLAIAFAGVTTIAVATSTGRHDATGVLLALGAAALYAVGVLLQKQALRTVDPFSATWLGCVAGAVACLPFAPALIDEVGGAPAAATAGVVYLGVFPTPSRSPPGRTRWPAPAPAKLGSSSYLVPALAVAMSWRCWTRCRPARARRWGAVPRRRRPDPAALAPRRATRRADAVRRWPGAADLGAPSLAGGLFSEISQC
jgi:drug/metabolite transporter (DMT)-like permease